MGEAANGSFGPAAAARAAGLAFMGVDAPLPNPDLIAAIPRLRRYARVLTGDRSRADDLVQETLARGWEKRRLWSAGSDLRAWLFTIMHNVFVNERTRALREARHVQFDDEASAAAQVPVSPPQLPHVELLEVLRALGTLPEEQREVLVLAVVEQMHYDEIAAVLSIPIGTVMSRLSRAREKLRRATEATPGRTAAVRRVF